MEGGITSGIVYPRAIVRLATKYNFRNIGGTSAGAIAAAATAAAEYRRQHDGDYRGFELLNALPDELGASRHGATKLFSLFRPQEPTAPLFHALTAGLGAKGFLAVVAILWRALDEFWQPVLLASGSVAAIVVALAACSGWPCSTFVLGAVLGVLAALLGALGGAFRCLTRDVVNNGYGLCRGFSRGAEEQGPDGDEPLTLWLSRLINRCAGRAADGDPLTFGDLWEAGSEFPPAWLKDHVAKDVPAIRLEMITTSVTNGRPFRVPFHDDDQIFFSPEDLYDYFPASVVRHLVDKAGPYKPTISQPALPRGMYRLPRNKDLPIVVAARLSLSFPLLISAVPLWMIDYEPKREQRTFERCWFSDGGLTSNFPIHLFDSVLPLWPTFGIQLESMLDRRPNTPLFLPDYNTEGRADPWLRFDEKEGSLSRLVGFLMALFDAARNWRDRTLAREPGVRDRVVRIRLEDDEGGLNLKMPQALVTKLAGHGVGAAERFLDHFVKNVVPKDGHNHPMGFDNQRWMRLRTLLSVLRDQSESIRRSLDVKPAGAKTWDQQLDDAAAAWTARQQTDPVCAKETFDDLGDLYPLPPGTRPKVERVFRALKELADALAAVPLPRDEDPPRVPTIRISPDL
jgi:predicted acylesterase/phospholipase RssA